MENSISVSQIHQVQTCKSMQRLKFELVNGYGVLVDGTKNYNEGDFVYDSLDKVVRFCKRFLSDDHLHKIIFAQKELNLEGVPVFEWRNFEVERLAKEWYDRKKFHSQFPADIQSFIQGYKSNPAKYTEEEIIDLITDNLPKLKKLQTSQSDDYGNNRVFVKEFLQSLQKYPKWVVMEGEEVEVPYFDESGSSKISGFKLFTNSEGKQQGTVKELIWDTI